MSDWKDIKQELEANEFASYLLMPLDDLRQQIGNNILSPSLIEHLANRYMVSRLAFLLKWISITEERAQLIISEEGYFKWSRSSGSLLKSGIFYKKYDVREVPEEAAALDYKLQPGQWLTKNHGTGIWSGEEVTEMSFQSYDQEGEITISLLIFPKEAPLKEEYDPDSIEIRRHSVQSH